MTWRWLMVLSGALDLLWCCGIAWWTLWWAPRYVRRCILPSLEDPLDGFAYWRAKAAAEEFAQDMAFRPAHWNPLHWRRTYAKWEARARGAA